jgi:hypothetical protein
VGIRTEITNQQAIASTNVPVDKKLATALRAALSKVDKANDTNSVTAAKAFASVAATLSKSSLSNTFGPLLDSAANEFLSDLSDGSTSLSNRLVLADDSSKRNAADKKVDLLVAQFLAANGEANLVSAAKLISKAIKTYFIAEKLVVKAENYEAPTPSGTVVTARINGSGFRSSPNISVSTYEPTHIAVIGGVKGANSLVIWVGNVTEGTTTHTLGGAGSESFVTYIAGTRGQAISTSGTVTITLDSTARTLTGTFSFEGEGPGIGNLLGHVSVTDGTFSAKY